MFHRYCIINSECFQNHVVTRVKSAFTRLPVSQGSTKLLVAVSGGPSSMLLTRLLSDYIETMHHNRRFDILIPCHIDERELIPENARLPELAGFCDHLGAPLRMHKLSQAFAGDEQTMKRAFDGVKSMTAREDLLVRTRNVLLMKIASELGCNYIAFGDSGTRLGINTILNIGLGRGYSLPLEVGHAVSYAEWPNLTVLRPMGELLAKQVALYNQRIGLEALHHHALSTKIPARSSMYRLTEEFIVGLDKDFPSTVSTVTRTASKLGFTGSSEDRCCRVCTLPMQSDSQEWRLRFTVASLGSVKSDQQSVDPDSIANDLCFGCLVNDKDWKANSDFEYPDYAASALETQKLSIAEYLIDDEAGH